MRDFSHIPVMLYETVDSMALKPGMTVADCTLGGGGHSKLIMDRIGPNGRLYGIDRDINAIEHCKAKFSVEPYASMFTPVKGNYADIKALLRPYVTDGLDAIVMDLGVSSHQIDTPERGFSYMHDSPLDMRMDPSQLLSAYDIVNGFSREELKTILQEYGEEKFAFRIADAIVRSRPIKTTFELNAVIDKAVPVKVRYAEGHTAKRTYQALRIAVNDEIAPLEKAIYDVFSLLKKGGRLSIITFHSLEAAAVKRVMRYLECDCICPPESPICTCDKEREAKIITKKPMLPSQRELEENPRAHSAQLRVCEKV
ncbi:MAG: 16S rRNA (cytosine(1402)-N(4))-methyltransferase RsmH [Clostridiales bacterium]|nr:16S rRNA (cytosine(1402)-N(4))-methyltransferase RsmH [Clostridiales bacterium]